MVLGSMLMAPAAISHKDCQKYERERERLLKAKSALQSQQKREKCYVVMFSHIFRKTESFLALRLTMSLGRSCSKTGTISWKHSEYQLQR